MKTNGPIPQAYESGKTKEQQCDENTDSPGLVQKVSAEQVNPAISPPISPSTDENYKTESDGNKCGNQSGTGNEKPNCYGCKHRGSLSYSAHSQCNHPALNGKGKIFAISCMLRLGYFPELGVTGNSHGIANGWFSWPLDFDPIWLDSCEGFEKK